MFSVFSLPLTPFRKIPIGFVIFRLTYSLEAYSLEAFSLQGIDLDNHDVFNYGHYETKSGQYWRNGPISGVNGDLSSRIVKQYIKMGFESRKLAFSG